jgi:hypothetical protein
LRSRRAKGNLKQEEIRNRWNDERAKAGSDLRGPMVQQLMRGSQAKMKKKKRRKGTANLHFLLTT